MRTSGHDQWTQLIASQAVSDRNKGVDCFIKLALLALLSLYMMWGSFDTVKVSSNQIICVIIIIIIIIIISSSSSSSSSSSRCRNIILVAQR